MPVESDGAVGRSAKLGPWSETALSSPSRRLGTRFDADVEQLAIWEKLVDQSVCGGAECHLGNEDDAVSAQRLRRTAQALHLVSRIPLATAKCSGRSCLP